MYNRRMMNSQAKESEVLLHTSFESDDRGKIFDILLSVVFLSDLCKDWKAVGRGACHQGDAKCISTSQ